jgi:hypothetical protein
MSHFIAMPTITAPATATAFMDQVVRLHGLPLDIVSDRGSQFVSTFWSALTDALGVTLSLSTTAHQQTDGQSERTIQTMEQYLRHFVAYLQDDWSAHLAMAEFAFNNSRNASTNKSPFEANYGYTPKLQVPTVSPKSSSPAASDFVSTLSDIHQELHRAIQLAQTRMKLYADRKRQEGPTFAVGDQVLLNTKNLKLRRPCAKLSERFVGPFPVTQINSPVSYKLLLPKDLPIHDVFHVDLLEPYHANAIPHRVAPPPPPIVIEGDQEFEVDEILDSRMHRNRLQYRVRWSGYGPQSDSWQPATDLTNCVDALADFHRRFPHKPKAKTDIAKTVRFASTEEG